MALYEHAQESFGKPVKEWRPGVPLDDPSGTAYRLALEYDEAEAGVKWEARFNEFLSLPGSSSVRSIVIGVWGDTSDPLGDSAHVVNSLIQASARLSALRTL